MPATADTAPTAPTAPTAAPSDTAATARSPHHRPRCTACGGALARVRRRSAEKAHAAETVGAELRRYACASVACGWQGLLPRSRSGTAGRRRWRHLQRGLRRWRAGLALAAGLGAAVAAVAVQSGVLQAAALPAVAPGVTREGTALPAAHPLARHHAHAATRAPLALRKNCVWGRPGGDPYRGTVEQALRSAALPEEVVLSIARQVATGQPVDRLEIGNDGVRAQGSGRVFDARHIAMTHGLTLCLSTRVNFVPGHTERAALYEATDAKGRVVAVMVPEVCGNVSVLGQRAEGDKKKVLQARAVGEPGYRWLPMLLDAEPGTGIATLGADGPRAVPEPGTLATVLAALGVLAALRLRRG